MQGPESFGGGMEYPTITVISPASHLQKNWILPLLMKSDTTGFMEFWPAMKEIIPGWMKGLILIMNMNIPNGNTDHLILRKKYCLKQWQ